ncbi:pre-mRNA-processing protein 40A [Daucus carota subsp. sativus]|uniref:pre-mRNA-processing protein 40A n=1 Tax=Daucus carota subsp. sativus TaxID=79200 RepID=UPI0007F01361|nr:PREDICTED: pre-mRNA-processing protein 40A [Daucus carota subsp. sativus]
MANNPQAPGGQTLRPPSVGPMGSQNFGAPYPMQFRPMAPALQGQHPMPVSSASQQFSPAGQVMHPGQGQQPLQYSQPMQHLQSRPLQPGPVPPSQATQMPYLQQNMTYASGQQQYQQAAPANGHGYGGPGVPLSSSYTYTASYGQPQNTMNMPPQFQPASQIQMPAVPVGGQPWLPPISQGLPAATPMQPIAQQPAASPGPVTVVSSPHTSSDWQEFEASDGRRYYYNKITKQSCWEKPLELMTPLEKADASTVWKEFTTAEGRKYYYNKITKQSKWSIPDELKLAREQAEKAAGDGSQSESVIATSGTAKEMVDVLTTAPPSNEVASTTVGVASSPVPVTPVSAPLMTISESATPVVNVAADTTTATVAGSVGLSNASVNVNTTPVTGSETPVSRDAGNSSEGASVQDIEEAKKGKADAGKINSTPVEDKTVEDEPFLYANKQEAKNAFKALLESANVEADWNWEQAMRVIINDKRYGALKTLGERKQTFNEYLMQRKKLEAEERRLRQRKAKEEFTKMLEESRELTSSMRWSKAATLFENDERFKAVERAADREDLFKNYLVDLQKKEKMKAQEEYRQNRLDYRKFLETCGLVKVDTQWRKVQDRMEESESGSRLEKIDRLEIFQEYIRDLEKEEDEQRKIKKEQVKRVERKNRDEFRKMMEVDVASGNFTAKTLWFDYCQKVKDSAPYHAVALNLSGSTPKELFEDVSEDLQRQYDEDKANLKDALKSAKITVESSWTFEDFKTAIAEIIDSLSISSINLQLVFEDLLERVKEKEEKEAKKRQRLAEDFSDKLRTIKDITASSEWDECKQLFDSSSEYRAIKEESSARQIFEEHIARLQEKARDKERKREEEKAKKEKEKEEKEKRKERERREKEKEKEHEKDNETSVERSKDNNEGENLDAADNYVHKEDKKREKDRERKHRKRHHNDVNSEEDEKEDSYKKSRRHGSEDEKEHSKKSRRHGSDDENDDGKKSRRHGSEDEIEDTKKSRRHGSGRKKSRKHAYTPESDGESRHKRHRRDHRDGSRRTGGHDELEDGELGEDGEIQ